MTRYFITRVLKSKKQNDSIKVVVDKLSKLAHFISVQSTYQDIQIVDIFMREIFRVHRIPKMVVSNRDVKFTFTFWKALFTGLGTQVQFSTAYHPQMNGKTKQVNQVLEDMLRMYVMQQPIKWEEYIHLVEFVYNNAYHVSLRMISPFKVLYRRNFQKQSNGTVWKIK